MLCKFELVTKIAHSLSLALNKPLLHLLLLFLKFRAFLREENKRRAAGHALLKTHIVLQFVRVHMTVGQELVLKYSTLNMLYFSKIYNKRW